MGQPTLLAVYRAPALLGTYLVLLQQVPVVPSDFTGSIEGIGAIVPECASQQYGSIPDTGAIGCSTNTWN